MPVRAGAKYYAALTLMLNERKDVLPEDPEYLGLINNVVEMLLQQQEPPPPPPPPVPPEESPPRPPSDEEDSIKRPPSNACPTTFTPVYLDPKVHVLSQVQGMDKIRQQLFQGMLFPLRFPKTSHLQDYPVSNRLFYGAGGTGKTMLIKALVAKANLPFVAPDTSQIKGMYVGQSEKCLGEAIDAAAGPPNGVLFLDEVDALLGGQDEHSRKLSAFFKEKVQPPAPPLILSATNDPGFVLNDSGLHRRLGISTYVPLPTPQERIDFVNNIPRQVIDCNGKPFELTDKDVSPEQWGQIAKMTAGFSFADLRQLVNEARRFTPGSFPNAMYSSYLQEATGEKKWIPVPATTLGSITFQQLYDGFEDSRQRDEFFRRVCWKFVDGESILKVLNESLVRPSVTIEQLQVYLKYARRAFDIEAERQIRYTIDEMVAAKTGRGGAV